MHLSIAGNIGAGKTTLTGLLADHFKYKAHYENIDKNPYINDFYQDMKKWAFHLQMYFLEARFKQSKALENEKNIIQDRTIYEDAYIFAANLHQMGLLDTRDYQTYLSFFEFILSSIKPPDLLIYLKASVSTLITQIGKRGREYEKEIDYNYLQKLNDFYEKWIENYKDNLIVFEIDHLNFVENNQDRHFIFTEIESKTKTLL